MNMGSPFVKKDRHKKSSGIATSPRQQELVRLWMPGGRIKSPEDIPAEAILADPNAIFSRSAIPNVPVWYEDKSFKCKQCGRRETWTARQQQWWYEIAKGEIETTAILCRACRQKKRLDDAAMTENTRIYRQQRAERRAADLANELRLRGTEGFKVLDYPLSELQLRARPVEQLHALGLRTVGDVVEYDGITRALRLNTLDRFNLINRLKELGLRLVGAKIPRSRVPK
jgi:hypothetical protein